MQNSAIDSALSIQYNFRLAGDSELWSNDIVVGQIIKTVFILLEQLKKSIT